MKWWTFWDYTEVWHGVQEVSKLPECLVFINLQPCQCQFFIQADNDSPSLSFCVKSDLWWTSLSFPSLSFSFRLFVRELHLTVPSVAIQLWSRAVLQVCHDRINENNIAKSHFIHITGERTQNLILKENVRARGSRQWSDRDSNWNRSQEKNLSSRKGFPLALN